MKNFSGFTSSWVVVLLTVLLSGCSISLDVAKRHHLPGYYFNLSVDRNTQSSPENFDTLPVAEQLRSLPEEVTTPPRYFSDVAPNKKKPSEVSPDNHRNSYTQNSKSRTFEIPFNLTDRLSGFNILTDLSTLFPANPQWLMPPGTLGFSSPGAGRARQQGRTTTALGTWIFFGSLALFAGLIMFFGPYGTYWSRRWGQMLMVFGASTLASILLLDTRSLRNTSRLANVLILSGVFILLIGALIAVFRDAFTGTVVFGVALGILFIALIVSIFQN